MIWIFWIFFRPQIPRVPLDLERFAIETACCYPEKPMITLSENDKLNSAIFAGNLRCLRAVVVYAEKPCTNDLDKAMTIRQFSASKTVLGQRWSRSALRGRSWDTAQCDGQMESACVVHSTMIGQEHSLRMTLKSHAGQMTFKQTLILDNHRLNPILSLNPDLRITSNSWETS